jgi:citrate lyase subunit beta/citryl-CoA lyase
MLAAVPSGRRTGDVGQRGRDGWTDAVVFDLEDAVAPDSKGEARRTVRGTLESLDDPAPARCVRITPYDRTGRADVEAVSGTSTPPDGVVLPKAAGADDVATLRDHLADLGATVVGIVPLIGTAAGVVAAADVDAIDTVFTRIEDDDGLRTQTERIVEFDFDGKLAIPRPDADHQRGVHVHVEWAERVVERRRGTGDGRVHRRRADDRSAVGRAGTDDPRPRGGRRGVTGV